MPTSGYAAELFEIFRKAATERVTITLPTKSAAYALRYRLNKLRADMRKEEHFMVDIANAVSFIIQKTAENVLICEPADKAYLQNIRDAIGEPSPEAVAAQGALGEKESVATTRITGDDALAEYFATTEKKE